MHKLLLSTLCVLCTCSAALWTTSSIGRGWKRYYAGIAIRGAQVVLWTRRPCTGNTVELTPSSARVAPLKILSGSQETASRTLFSNPDSLVSEDFTIRPCWLRCRPFNSIATLIPFKSTPFSGLALLRGFPSYPFRCYLLVTSTNYRWEGILLIVLLKRFQGLSGLIRSVWPTRGLYRPIWGECDLDLKDTSYCL